MCIKTPISIIIALILLSLNAFTQKGLEKEKYFKKLLQNVDNIELRCIKNKDTSTFTVIEKKEIKTFTDMISGRQDLAKKDDSMPRGFILYYSNRVLVLQVVVLNTGISYHYKNEKINSLSTYQGDMLFNETCSPHGFNINE